MTKLKLGNVLHICLKNNQNQQIISALLLILHVAFYIIDCKSQTKTCLLPLQVDAGLTFNKKDLEHSFIFDIKTIDRVFYLVADTEEEMNKWVRCICDICGFNPTDDGEDWRDIS